MCAREARQSWTSFEAIKTFFGWLVKFAGNSPGRPRCLFGAYGGLEAGSGIFRNLRTQLQLAGYGWPLAHQPIRAIRGETESSVASWVHQTLVSLELKNLHVVVVVCCCCCCCCCCCFASPLTQIWWVRSFWMELIHDLRVDSSRRNLFEIILEGVRASRKAQLISDHFSGFKLFQVIFVFFFLDSSFSEALKFFFF